MSLLEKLKIRNVGALDRALRLLPGLLVLTLYFQGKIDGWLCMTLAAISLVLLLTAALARCPIYSLIGFSSCAVKKS